MMHPVSEVFLDDILPMLDYEAPGLSSDDDDFEYEDDVLEDYRGALDRAIQKAFLGPKETAFETLEEARILTMIACIKPLRGRCLHISVQKLA